MAGTRQYRRKSNGQFAGSGGGTVTTTGRSGGFASAAHRANVASRRAAKAHRSALIRKGIKLGETALVIGAVGAGAKYASAVVAGNNITNKTKAAQSAFRASSPRSRSTTLTTVKAGRTNIPIVAARKRGSYNITTATRGRKRR